jgi:predicted dehydrogenase
MIKLGVLDFDTSHVVEFTKRLNHKDIDKEQWVEGAEVVIGCAGESKIAPERIPGYIKEMEKLGVPLVDKPADMIGKVDGMLIESQEGAPHLERARPFLEAGLPCFIDKPFTCSLANAKKVVELAEKHKTVVFSSSSLRYAPDVIKFLEDKDRGKIQGVLAYGPAPFNEKDLERNPGLYHYGVHVAEILYTVMGPGCQRLSCTHEKDVDVVTGQWKDGRVAGLRGQRPGGPYGFVAFTDKGVKHVPIDTKFIYRELVKKIVEFFDKKKAPVDPAETLEIMGFIEAALKSANNHGAGETVTSG